MDINEIKAMAEDFIDWPTDRREFITYQTAMRFAQYCASLAVERKAKQAETELNETLKRHL